jgi:hypothetical protein
MLQRKDAPQFIGTATPQARAYRTVSPANTRGRSDFQVPECPDHLLATITRRRQQSKLLDSQPFEFVSPISFAIHSATRPYRNHKTRSLAHNISRETQNTLCCAHNLI